MRLRLFVGIDLPDAQRDAVARVIAEGRARSPRSKWVPPENVHVTLVFLGGAEEPAVEPLSAALADAVRAHAPFTLALRDAGTFGAPRRPRVAWVGVHGDVDQLRALQADVARACAAQGFGIEERAYKPHVTVARARDERGDRELAGFGPAELGELCVREVTLFRSLTGPGGSRYERLRRFPLTSG